MNNLHTFIIYPYEQIIVNNGLSLVCPCIQFTLKFITSASKDTKMDKVEVFVVYCWGTFEASVIYGSSVYLPTKASVVAWQGSLHSILSSPEYHAHPCGSTVLQDKTSLRFSETIFVWCGSYVALIFQNCHLLFAVEWFSNFHVQQIG